MKKLLQLWVLTVSSNVSFDRSHWKWKTLYGNERGMAQFLCGTKLPNSCNIQLNVADMTRGAGAGLTVQLRLSDKLQQ